MTKVCVPIMAASCGEMARQINAARATGADMIELRLDGLKEWTAEGLQLLIDKARGFGCEVIATCRIKREGGQYEGDEAARIRLLQLAAKAGADYVDVEYAAKTAWPWPPADNESARGPKLILSKHDLTGTPADLDAIFAELLAADADVVKLACQANSIADSPRMLDALRNARKSGRGVIAICMGEPGILTRVLAKKFGALLTFAALNTGKESAPGQPTIEDLRELYRWNAIGPRTQVYGVIGCPIGHSMSPAIHNAAFDAVGYDGVYLPMCVEPSYEALAAFLDGCLDRPWLDVRGMSVTIPHKENLLRYVAARGGDIDPLTRRIGAANTLHIERAAVGYALHAFNTDYRGALDALCQGMNCQPKDLAGLPMAVLGAGGVSRAIVAGLTDCGCRVTVYNRTADKAAALAREFGTEALPWEQRTRPDARVIVNCTSIGMWPRTSDTPLERFPSRPDLVVFDTVYNPIETRLLSKARENGYRTIDGAAMFIGQAAIQFEHWTGRPAPAAVMRERLIRTFSR